MSFGAFIVRVGVEAAVHDRFVHRFWHEPERTIDLGAGEVPDHLECHRYVFTVYRLVYARLRDAHLPGYLTLRLATHEGERDPGELARWDEPSPHARRPELLLRLPRDRDRTGRERRFDGMKSPYKLLVESLSEELPQLPGPLLAGPEHPFSFAGIWIIAIFPRPFLEASVLYARCVENQSVQNSDRIRFIFYP